MDAVPQELRGQKEILVQQAQEPQVPQVNKVRLVQQGHLGVRQVLLVRRVL